LSADILSAGMSSPQPRGRPPKGKVWDSANGEWVDAAMSDLVARPEKSADNKRPRGRPPAGKSWSEEAGGYVDAASAADGSVPVAKKRPRGRPPAGKSWSEEAGAYVQGADNPATIPPPPDLVAITTEGADLVPAPQPSEPAAKTSKPKRKSEGSRPRGRPPHGKMWSEEAGAYVVGEGSALSTKALKKGSGRPRGRPPHGKVWSEDVGAYVVVEDAY